MHDRNGKPVKAGDRVNLQGEIQETTSGPDYCNVKVLITEKGESHGAGNVQCVVWVNAKQTEKIDEQLFQ